ncbi:helix-turn-helix transcriptional regulator [Candidatus Xianfuyuplasma coldseepsis]|uniref:Helix-turn-helix transcriptional regulator n=1 Tax=Candidatus Xianfuyuplasma coldseepsis TaxID=2782163 RepID=A0A7L7KQ00_9MOLU|nr:helix-turn-helix transcriptional regulator [Xianfuyuplasma coldseepsis]QMS84871.1 helix-turn-helix transcriptional regulator [Xianfuyuplasma coldseepsis]
MKIKQVSNTIKDYRYQHQMSQEVLANLVGCTRQTIISLEQNKYSPSFVLVAKIAQIFDIPVDDVIQITFEETD